jgi:hypothetical protein
MVDEMDLLRGLKDAEPVRPRAFEEARAVLRTAMTIEEVETKTAPRQRARWGTRRTAGFSVAALGAAAAAVALVVTSTSAPSHHAAATGKPPATAAPAVAHPVLAQLAANITASSGQLTSDASLVIQTRTLGSQPPLVDYFLYTDTGVIYSGYNKSSLVWEIAHHSHDPINDGYYASVMAAARYAATGDLTTARVRMALASGGNPLGLGLSPAARQKQWDNSRAHAQQLLKEKGAKNIKIPANPPTGKALQSQVDNYVWMNSTAALTMGGGDPRVRAGVLRLLSAISGVTVADSATGGNPTLTLTVGPGAFGGGPGKEVMVIDAKTGVPISDWSGDLPPSASTGQPTPPSMTTYQVSRVTMAKIAAGNF